ncbi:hypothetical protein C7974DRAFT_315963 [Boeremia exigua]|uniref:uncharacterized protein n=1 Tax=Boeremia exigua TaxID=749465 RepID=UPI001E8E875F|nr:uncharacterized protein C7974DRAFT_315963 [Boeremia exigua]KAH6620534.1 hypothetical protein C7974DRAFT_315963 [Boeremia exigua]
MLTTVSFTITETATATATSTETTTLSPPPPPVSTLTVIYPSPDAAPVEVTSISQVVTSYIPEATFCVGPALYFSSISGGPFFNGSANVTQYISGTTSCSTEYLTTTKTICATTLTGIASKITVSECDQEITFSSECGYSLETPPPTPATPSNCPLITPAPTIYSLTTYWLAPWQSLTSGAAPSDVAVKVCTQLADGTAQCQRYQEVWEVFPVTSTLTTALPITFSRTLAGPGALIIDASTSFINSTAEVVDLSKTLRLETEVTLEGTSTVRPSTTVRLTTQTTSTRTVTRHLQHAASTPMSTSVSDLTSESSSAEPTTTVLVTSFVTERRTHTITRPRSRTLSRGEGDA